MKLNSILKKVGGSLLRNAMPPLSGIAFDLINAALPADKKLDNSTTGLDAEQALATLPPEQQASLLEKELDVEITEIKEWTNVVGALAEVDKTGNTTRPKIALEQSILVGFGVIITLSSISYAIVTGDSQMIDSVKAAWPLILAIIGIPAGIVNSYFGKRAKDKAKKYESITNTPPTPGLISQIAGMFSKR